MRTVARGRILGEMFSNPSRTRSGEKKEHGAREREAEALHAGEAARGGHGCSDRPVGRIHSSERCKRGFVAATGVLPEPGDEMSRLWNVEAPALGRSSQGC